MECEFPTINEPNQEIENILKSSKTVAIIGLSPKPEKDSYQVAKYLIEAGYTIYPVYPKEESILGQKVYRSISEIEGDIDIVDVFRKPDALGQVVDEVINRGGVKTVWFQLGLVNNSAAQRARDAGLDVVQSRCIKVEHQRMKRQSTSNVNTQ